MALLLTDIEWGEPLLPVVDDPAWKAEVASRGGLPSATIDLRTAPLPWLREYCFAARTSFYSLSAMPDHLFPLVAMVVAQVALDAVDEGIAVAEDLQQRTVEAVAIAAGVLLRHHHRHQRE